MHTDSTTQLAKHVVGDVREEAGRGDRLEIIQHLLHLVNAN